MSNVINRCRGWREDAAERPVNRARPRIVPNWRPLVGNAWQGRGDAPAFSGSPVDLGRTKRPFWNRWRMPSKKPAPSSTYAEWRKRAREKLAGPIIMPERAWTHAFIIGKTPDEAAAEANT